MLNFIKIIFYFLLLAINIFSLSNVAIMHNEIVELQNLNVEHLKKINDSFSNLKIINAGNYVWLMLIFSMLLTALVFLKGADTNTVVITSMSENHRYILEFLKEGFSIVNKNILDQTKFIDNRFLNISSNVASAVKCNDINVNPQDLNQIFKGLTSLK